MFPTLEVVAFFLHVILYFVIIIVLVYLAPKQENVAVWNTFNNGGEFGVMGEAVLAGSVNIMFGFAGRSL